jgi:hypothetical protein
MWMSTKFVNSGREVGIKENSAKIEIATMKKLKNKK